MNHIIDRLRMILFAIFIIVVGVYSPRICLITIRDVLSK